ncbi:MAG: c-type cytochrome [Hyphomicrobiales bacterium]|nr:c-type cytochrome [Hyphomicrobiales bacterium]
MTGTMAKVSLFLLIVLGIYLLIGYEITSMTGGGQRTAAVVDVSPESGETIYWGKGRCFTCHSVGGQGSAVRGPNHGQFGEKFPDAMGERAVKRAAERSEKTGDTWTAVDYMVESLAEPGAYVVEGYKNEMAVVYAPPISLNLTEIKAVVMYLLAQGGDPDAEAVDTGPSDITQQYYSKIEAAQAAGGGDPTAGAEVFDDNCSECHSLEAEPGEVGPGLAGIAGKGLPFISDAILLPAKAITKSYETYVVIDNEGRQTIGLKSRDESGEVDITKATGEVVTIAKADIKEIKVDETKSVMPDDLSEAMTVKDYQDILSFLMTQKAAAVAEGDSE